MSGKFRIYNKYHASYFDLKNIKNGDEILMKWRNWLATIIVEIVK